jgi:hypothetical protein
VVCPSTAWVDQTTGNTRNEKRIVDLQLNHGVQLFVACLEHAIKLLSLGNCAGETIQDETKAKWIKGKGDASNRQHTRFCTVCCFLAGHGSCRP